MIAKGVVLWTHEGVLVGDGDERGNVERLLHGSMVLHELLDLLSLER